MNRLVAAVVVLVFRGDRLLAMRRAPDKDAAPGAWEALSGRLRLGEQPIDAASRETAEESGLTVRLRPRPVTAYMAKRNDDDMLVVAYHADSASGDVTLSAEHDRYEWMTVEQFASTCTFPLLVATARLAAESD